MRIEVYQELHKPLWDGFVRRSKNGTFLFLRDYMEYHRDRFHDHSLLLWDDRQELIALLPANMNGDTASSHGGLTYGGFITDASMKAPKMLQVFDETLAYLKEHGQNRFVYKTIPHIYHRLPAEEDRYALFLCNARLTRCGVLTVVSNWNRLPFQDRRNRGIRKAKQQGLTVCETTDFALYWEILQERLEQAHHTKPVHTVSEIRLLQSRFPENIRLFACYQAAEMLAGVVVYESDMVAHVQYIAASDRGRELSALDLIFDELLNRRYNSKPYFDFGTSDENDGRTLNRGLIDQKEGFGARVVTADHYEISLATWQPSALGT